MAEKKRDKDGRILPENVTQRKDGTYMWRKRVKGKNYCLYAKTLGEIKQKRNIALGEIEAGTFKGKHEKMAEERELAKKDITLNEWFFQWEKTYRVGIVKNNTLQAGHAGYMIKFADNIGRMKMKDIKQIDITNVLKEMKKEGICYGSIKKYYNILPLIFNAAIDNGIIEKNPAIGALAIKKEEPKARRILSVDEERRFMEFIKNHRMYKYYVPFFTTGFGTGMRIGELLALQWSDIDFEGETININKGLVYVPDYIENGGKYSFSISTPKTKKSVRIIPMTKKVKEELQAHRNRNMKCIDNVDGYNDFVFVGLYSKKMQHPSVVRNIINGIVDSINQAEKEAAKREGREPLLFERFSPHCMRHTFATRCYENGVKEKVVQEILGHSSIDMTMNVYTHTTDEMIRNEISKMK